MTFIKALFFFAALAASGSAAATSRGAPAASAAPPNAAQSMRVVVVRSASDGCEPHCDEWISAEGKIDKQTLGRFRRTLKSLGARKLPIFINSGGGDIAAAMQIGRLLRAEGLDVAVARTDFAPRAEPAAGEMHESAKPPPLRGWARSRQALCASACTLILAAGEQRLVGPGALVGVHEIIVPEQTIRQKVRYYQIRILRKGDRILSREKILLEERTISRHIARSKASPEVYRKIRDYLVEMGGSRAVVELMKTAPPEKIRWLTRTEIAATRLSTEDRGDETVVALAPSAPQPVATPARYIVPDTPLVEPQAETPSREEAEPAVGHDAVATLAIAAFTILWLVARLMTRLSTFSRKPRSPPSFAPGVMK